MRRPPRLTSTALPLPNSGCPMGLQNTGASTRWNLRRSTARKVAGGPPGVEFPDQDPLPSSSSGSSGFSALPASGLMAARVADQDGDAQDGEHGLSQGGHDAFPPLHPGPFTCRASLLPSGARSESA